jgi:hypothetical protein
MVAAALLIGLFVATMGTLMAIGWRQRPQLEIPPRPWPTPELPAEAQRLTVRLLVLGLLVYATGASAFLSLRAFELDIAANVVGGLALAVYLGLLIARIVVVARFALEARRKSETPLHSTQ